MGRVKYVSDEGLSELVRDIVVTLRDYLAHVDLRRIAVVKSFGSGSRALARVHALPGVWRFVLGLGPMYVIEVLAERFEALSPDEKVRVLIHELLHIPKSFGGGLRPHRPYVSAEVVERLFRIYVARRGRHS